MDFHRQLHSQFESSTPTKKKKRIKEIAGVSPRGESPMLKSAKVFYIFQIERDFSEDVCIPGSGGSVGLI